MKKYRIINLHKGKYGLLLNNFLSFEINNDEIFEIDKKSALEIAYTLFDSVGLLNNQAEKLLEKVEEMIDE